MLRAPEREERPYHPLPLPADYVRVMQKKFYLDLVRINRERELRGADGVFCTDVVRRGTYGIFRSRAERDFYGDYPCNRVNDIWPEMFCRESLRARCDPSTYVIHKEHNRPNFRGPDGLQNPFILYEIFRRVPPLEASGLYRSCRLGRDVALEIGYCPFTDPSTWHHRNFKNFKACLNRYNRPLFERLYGRDAVQVPEVEHPLYTIYPDALDPFRQFHGPWTPYVFGPRLTLTLYHTSVILQVYMTLPACEASGFIYDVRFWELLRSIGHVSSHLMFVGFAK